MKVVVIKSDKVILDVEITESNVDETIDTLKSLNDKETVKSLTLDFHEDVNMDSINKIFERNDGMEEVMKMTYILN